LRIVFIGPFAFYPKGTVPVRMLPLAKELRRNGHYVEIVLPPYDNLVDSGKSYMIDGIDVHNVIIPENLKGLKFLVVAVSLVRRALRSKPDVVHVFKPKGYSGLAGMLLVVLRFLMFTRVPVVVDTDDLEGVGGFADLFLNRGAYPGWMVNFFGIQERFLLGYSDVVTAASKFLERRASQLRGKNPGSVFYVPNGPSSMFVNSKDNVGDVKGKLGLIGKRVILLYTRFFEYKVKEVLDILERVVSAHSDINLLVVGKGEFGEEKELLRSASELGLLDYITYAGWVKPEAISAYIKAGDVAIYPFEDTLLNRAKCPGKIVQLMSLGKPIVADAVGQIAEYIEHGKSGLLAQSGDYEDFARQVVELLENEELRNSLGAEAKKRINRVFNWKLLAHRVQEAYNSIS
jgi:glycosyltransferase involved in cell wall biosynthesis